MHNVTNLRIYKLWAPFYDLLFQGVMARPRRTLFNLLQPQPYERWLIPGIGTGQDLIYFPPQSSIVAGDLSSAMLAKAIAKAGAQRAHFHLVDAQRLPFAAAVFDGVLLNLILSVVPDGSLAMREAWRVLKPGGRIGIFDKFLPEQQDLTPARRLAGYAVRQVGTDPNRRFADLIAGLSGLEIVAHLPSLLAGQYQLVLLRKR